MTGKALQRDMYLTEGIGAAATARPNPRPRSRPRPRLIPHLDKSSVLKHCDAPRLTPSSKLGLWHGIAGLGWPIRRNAWHDTRRAFRSILALFHHLLSDVLAYWRWYGERAADTALPEIYQQFVQKIESSKVLQRLCSDQLHELK